MKRFNLINAIGDAIIPIAGLLFFDWGLYFILLFYFIDLLAIEVFSYLKVNKIIANQRIKYPFQVRYGRLMINSVLTILLILMAHIATGFIIPNIQFYTEFIDFLKYEEVGFPIPQGYILLPLVILGNYQQYKLTFLRPQLYRVTRWSTIVQKRRKALLIGLIGAVFAMLLAILYPFPEWMYVGLLIIVKFYVDLKIN